MHTEAAAVNKRVKKKFPMANNRKDRKDNITMILMCLPVFLHLFIFSYLPMIGVVIAFKDYRYDKGIFKSDWIGFKNFEFFFSSQDAWRITRNTIVLNTVFIIVGLIAAVALALILFEITNKFFINIYQTVMILPSYLSWVIVGYMSYAFLNPSFGVINVLLQKFNIAGIEWYSNPKIWPFILTFAVVWKNMGLNCVIYYAGLMGINDEYYEAACIDGATRWQQTKYISIPFLVPLMTILTILAIGRIFRADFGMFFNLTRDIGALYETTDVIDTYVYRALRSLGDVGMSSAVGLYQSGVGFLLILITNTIVKRIEEDNALF